MMIDEVVFTHLTPKKVESIINDLKRGRSPVAIANPTGEKAFSQAYVKTIAKSQIHRQGPVFFKPQRDYQALLAQSLARSPESIIKTITDSRLRGRGGAGFPTGLKWQLAHDAQGAQKYIICNADEGEPGTFKDRALLTESPRDVLLGMVIAAYAIGARHGILYLRAEYAYLRTYLEQQIRDFQHQGLLGHHILGHPFEFNIRLQMGAGAYVCGDETALIESCEGKRGTPRVKPPYPTQQGYLGMPTCVNNVETFAAASRIIEEGADWFNQMGTKESSGTRLLSVSGDCRHPGIYEIEWGISLHDVLAMVGARDPMAVQVSGPSGECVSAKSEGERIFCYSDLACNGSLMIFDQRRDLLEIVRTFTRFFVDESCGICLPCRAGGVALQQKIDEVIAARITREELEEIHSWGELMQSTSRCGLGTTAAKPLLTSLKKFPSLYTDKLTQTTGPLRATFDPDIALTEHRQLHDSLRESDKP